ncbi:hypothetical protein BD408DRAFT_410012 [Parasitella parasitica]|nr:hypothetical protein BD408DRAFT_410012 [Parasitella parasitica]
MVPFVCALAPPASFRFLEGGIGFLKQTLIKPLLDIAPKIEIKFALAVSTFTIAGSPFGAHP